jgi:TP901 family phage tail tape measure protein
MADEKIVTSIVANSDFSNLIADVQRVTNSLSKLQQEFAGANRALAGQIDATNAMFSETMRKTGQFSTHFVSLTSDVEKFGRNLDSGRLKLRDYFRTYQEHARTNGGLIRDLAKQQVQMQNAVLQPLGRNAQGLMQYNVHIPRGLDLTKNKAALLKQELQIMNKVIQDGGVQLINWGKNTQWAGRQLTVGLTLPLAAFGKAAADAFKQADQELTRLTKVYGDIAGTSSQELGKIRNEVAATAKELSSAMGVSFTETIGLAADIAATGKTGNELLSSVSETTRLAVLGEVDRQEAMKATLAIQSAFKSNTQELAETINFLNAVENQTSTTLNDLVEAIPKAGPVIKGLGGSVQDLALYLTAMREGGVNASEGANALKSALASLINPTDVAVDKFKGFGIDLLGIVKNNAGDVTGTLLALQSALDKLDPLSKQQAIEQLFGKFQFSRLNALFENLGRQGSQTLQVLDLMNASAGELEAVAGRELAAVTESASGRYRRAIEGLKAELAGVGDEFLDIGTKLVNVLSKIIDFTQKLPDPIKKVMAFGGAFTAIIGPVIMLTGVLANFFGYIIKGLGHFKALFKGAEGFKLLTPEIMAARAASAQLSDEFYSDAAAAKTLSLAIEKLNADLNLLQQNATSIATIGTGAGRAVTTLGGSPIMTMGGPRVVDPTHPLLGTESRAAAHLNPRDPNNPSTIFGLTMQPVPLNRKIGRTPQIMMTERMPNIEGLTSVGGYSTGVVAGEHARYAALMATLGVQSRQEIEQLKKTIALGGQVSSEFIATFDDILPITQRLTQNAATQSAAIVADLRAGKLNVEQARAAIIAVNAELERMMGMQVSQYAAGRGRTIDLSKAPLIDQPVVDVSGKPNLRGMFRQGAFLDVMTAVGRATRTRTIGGPYSIETTKPQGLNAGGQVYMSSGAMVPGPNVNADVVPAMLTPGEFVVNREATAANLPLLTAINNGYNNGGKVRFQRGHVGAQLPGNGLSPSMLAPKSGATSYVAQGIPIWMTANMNQRLRSGDSGLYGSQIYEEFNIALRNGRHPFEPLITAARASGMPGEEARILSVFDEMMNDLGGKDANKLFRGGTANSFENHFDSKYVSRFGKDFQQLFRSYGTAYGQRGSRSMVAQGAVHIDPNTGRMSGISGRGNPLARGVPTGILATYGGHGFGGSREVMSQNLSRAALSILSRGRLRMNRGGMVPGYQEGGQVDWSRTPFGRGFGPTSLVAQAQPQTPIAIPRQRIGFGSMMGGMMLSSAGYYGGAALGGRFGATGSMVGGMLGGMLAPALMGGMGGLRGQSDPAVYAEKLGRSVAAQKAWAQSAAAAAGQGKIWGKILTGLVGGLTKTNLIIGGATLAIGAAVKVWKNYNETQRLSAAAFGLTAESAQKAGLKFTDYNAKVKDAIAAQKLMIDQNMLTYESLQSAGTPFKMTIAEYKKLRKELKETMAEQIKVINATSRPDAARVAVQLKEQLMAAGLSAEEAAKRIYTLFNLSNKAGMAVSVINTDAFKQIVDSQTAAASALQSFNYAKNFENTKDAAAALNTALTAINTGVEDLVSKSEKAAKKKGQEFDETTARYEAEKKQLDIIANKVGAQEAIGQGVLNNLKKQNPEIEKFINKQDTAVSMFQKLRLVAMGFTGDLSKMNAEQTDMIYKLQIATAQAVETVNKKGLLSKEYSELKRLGDLKKKYESAAKGQSVKEQIDTKERLKALDKEIKRINDKAEAKKKALREEAQAEDVALRVQQQRLEYEKAVASGDFGGAASAQLELQRTLNEQQVVLAEQQIEERRLKDIAPLERQREKIQNAQDDLANKAALAADSLDLINKRYDKQKQKIDDVNTSMTALQMALKLNAKNIEEFKTTKEFKGLAADFVVALKGIGINMPEYTYAGGGMPIKTDVGTFALDQLNKFGAGIDSILAQNDVTVTASGDIFIDGKKINDGKEGPKYTMDNPYVISSAPKSKQYELNEKGTLSKKGGNEAIRDKNLQPGDVLEYKGIRYKVRQPEGNMDPKTWYTVAQEKKAAGGLLRGPGTGKSDSILGMYANGGMVRVSNGEYIVNADTVSKLGVPFFDRINGMKSGGLMLNYNVPKYNEGSELIQAMAYQPGTGGSVYNVGNVTMQFAEAPADGRQLFEEFKAAMALDQRKTGTQINMSRRYP